eukprot:1088703-Amphidinium_carterae.3
MDGLPIALAALGHRVMTIAPRYDQYEEAAQRRNPGTPTHSNSVFSDTQAWDTSYWSSVPMGDCPALSTVVLMEGAHVALKGDRVAMLFLLGLCCETPKHMNGHKMRANFT